MAIQGFLNGPMDVALFTLRQRRTDPAWMGRAFAVSMALNFVGYPFGAAIGGALVGLGVAVPLGVAVGASRRSRACSPFVLLPRKPPRRRTAARTPAGRDRPSGASAGRNAPPASRTIRRTSVTEDGSIGP